MVMSVRFGHIKTSDLVDLYTVKHLTLRQIAKLTGMSHTSVMGRLTTAGVATKQGTWVNGHCDFCGAKIRKTRARWRNSQRHFCNSACYYATIENPNFIEWRHGQRLARAIVSQHFKISEDAVVHHKDGNDRNNNLNNLQVLDSQSSHTKFHRTGKLTGLLWDGSTVDLPSQS